MLEWIEKNPWLAGAIGLGGVLILLWLLGFFSSSSSGSTGSGSNLAAAYYAAEAAQTTAGTQLNMTQANDNASVSIANSQASAAVAIQQSQAGMYTTLGQQNAGVSTALGNDQLLASENSNDDALNASNTAASFAYSTAAAGYNAQNMDTYLNAVYAPEVNNFTGEGIGITPWGNFNTFDSPPTPAGLEQSGYTPAGVATILGLPYPGQTT